MHKSKQCALSANAQGWDLRAIDSQTAFVTGLVGDQQCNSKLNSCAEEGKILQMSLCFREGLFDYMCCSVQLLDFIKNDNRK